MILFTSSSDGMYSAGRSFCGREVRSAKAGRYACNTAEQRAVHIPHRFGGIDAAIRDRRRLYQSPV